MHMYVFFLRSIAMKFCVLWLLILATSVQVICQHWSYGLNPGGKRELHPFNQQTNVVGGFQHLGKPCRVLACGDLSPFAKLCRMKEFHGNTAGRQSGQKIFKTK
uniref:Progonadoliberin n=1 Tax=Hippocampus comes TaxID=109280 RepID=A0A3Q2YBB7_HIPCM